MHTLLFEAHASGRVFGRVVVKHGLATARVAQSELARVLFGHALLWLRLHNPEPASTVEFRLVDDSTFR